MKHIQLFLIALLLAFTTAFGQGYSTGGNAKTLGFKSLSVLTSDSVFILPYFPALAPAYPVPGRMYYNRVDSSVYYNNGAGWVKVLTSASGGGTVTSVTAGTGLSGGTITTSGTISMPNVGTAGTYGSTTQVPVLTTDAQGRVSGVTNTAISFPAETDPIATAKTVTLVAGSGISVAGGAQTVGANPVFTVTATGGTGTVTSVSVGNFSPLFTAGVSNPTTTPSISFSPISQSANLVYASPDGTSGNPAFRALVSGDIPALPYVSSVTAGTGLSGGTITSTGTISMPNVGTASTYGSSTQVPVLTTDAQGRVSAVTNTAIAFPSETDPIATAKTVTLVAGSGISVTGGAQTVGANPVFTVTATGGTGTVTSVTAGTGLSGGTITTSGTISMPNVGTASTYGSASQVPVITTDAQGRVSGVTNTSISIPFSSVTGVPYMQGLTFPAVKTANYTSVGGEYVRFNNTSGNDTLKLPNNPNDSTLVGAKITTLGGSNTVTILCQGTDTLNISGGSTYYTLKLINQGVILGYKKSEHVWVVINDNMPLGDLDARYAPISVVGSVTSVTAGTGLSGGTITTTGTISMPNTGTAGTYGSATQTPVMTTDAQGRVTGVTNTTITPAWSNITGTPTTLGGYGITDAYTKTSSDARYVQNVVIKTSGVLYSTPSVGTNYSGSDTVSLTLQTQNPHTVLSGATSGTVTPTFRQLSTGDLSDGTTGSGSIVLATGPTMTNPIVGTQSAGDNSTKAASTAYADGGIVTERSATVTLTNHRINPRESTTASSTSLTINSDATDIETITALAAAITINSPSGTPVQGQALVIRIKDNGTARAITWNSIFRAGDVALPTTTVISKTMYCGFFYNSTDSKWDMVAFINNF